MPSSEFRRRYASLREPVIVTVNGHAIGHYQPISTATDGRALDRIRPDEPPALDTFNTRPFTPVPKPDRR